MRGEQQYRRLTTLVALAMLASPAARAAAQDQAGAPAATPVITFDLTRQGDVLRGTSRGHNNLPTNVEFTRTPP